MDDIGETLRAARKQRGMSQAALASAISIRQATISDIERAGRLTNLPIIAKIAEHLGYSVIVTTGRIAMIPEAEAKAWMESLPEGD